MNHESMLNELVVEPKQGTVTVDRGRLTALVAELNRLREAEVEWRPIHEHRWWARPHRVRGEKDPEKVSAWFLRDVNKHFLLGHEPPAPFYGHEWCGPIVLVWDGRS